MFLLRKFNNFICLHLNTELKTSWSLVDLKHRLEGPWQLKENPKLETWFKLEKFCWSPIEIDLQVGLNHLLEASSTLKEFRWVKKFILDYLPMKWYEKVFRPIVKFDLIRPAGQCILTRSIPNGKSLGWRPSRIVEFFRVPIAAAAPDVGVSSQSRWVSVSLSRTLSFNQKKKKTLMCFNLKYNYKRKFFNHNCKLWVIQSDYLGW